MASAGQRIENLLTGERIVFVRTAAETQGRVLELDDFWTRRGGRAPEHVHPGMEERFEVVAGTAAFRIDGEELTLGPGEVVAVPPGTPHVNWNPTDGEVHLRLEFRPALRWEDFVVEMFALARAAHAAGREAPDREELAALIARFPRELAFRPRS